MTEEKDKQAAKAVLATARAAHVEKDIITKKGVKIRIESVPPSLLDDVTSRIKDPLPPMVFIESKGKEEPNTSDPSYQQALAEADDTRNRAAMDAMILFGVELIDGLPEDNKWIEKLQYLEKLGRLDLKDFDLKDKLDKEFLFKRYMISDAEVIRLVSAKSGVSPEEVAAIEDSFQDN